MPTQEKWDKHWLKVAKVTSELSKDPTTHVGAVIVTQDNRKCSIGYNGFVSGIEETEEKWQRPTKYLYSQHAEMNAIINCPFDTVGCILYCTHQCCHRCLEMVIQAGITRIIYISDYANLEHKDIWLEHSKLLKEIKKMDIFNE